MPADKQPTFRFKNANVNIPTARRQAAGIIPEIRDGFIRTDDLLRAIARAPGIDRPPWGRDSGLRIGDSIGQDILSWKADRRHVVPKIFPTTGLSVAKWRGVEKTTNMQLPDSSSSSSTARRLGVGLAFGCAAVSVASAMLRKAQRRRKRVREEGCLTLLGDPIAGQDKFLGGVMGGNGMIYGVPGHAKRVLKIDPATQEVSLVGPVLPGKYKWLRGVLAQDGNIYCIPCHAETVLRIDPRTDEVTQLPGTHGPLRGVWKWHGAVMDPVSGTIYGIPQFSEQVLKVVPATGEVSLIGGPFPGTHKWYGGLLGGDGCIYGIPQCAGSVIKINPRTEAVTTIGALEGGYKWHGGNTAGGNGIPCHADTVLKIDCSAEAVASGCQVSTIGRGAVPSGRPGPTASTSTWAGCWPRRVRVRHALDADRVLRIDPSKGTPRKGVHRQSLEDEERSHTRWQNGCGQRRVHLRHSPRGPQRAPGDCAAAESAPRGVVPTVPGLSRVAVSKDGALYCMPMQAACCASSRGTFQMPEGGLVNGGDEFLRSEKERARRVMDTWEDRERRKKRKEKEKETLASGGQKPKEQRAKRRPFHSYFVVEAQVLPKSKASENLRIGVCGLHERYATPKAPGDVIQKLD